MEDRLGVSSAWVFCGQNESPLAGAVTDSKNQSPGGNDSSVEPEFSSVKQNESQRFDAASAPRPRHLAERNESDRHCTMCNCRALARSDRL